MVYPHSHGILHLPGEYRTGSRPAPHKVEVATGEPGNPHVYTYQNQPGALGGAVGPGLLWPLPLALSFMWADRYS
jgi:hypothetical protein